MSSASNRPGIAVVGAGGWGKNHVRSLAGLGVLRRVCDRDPKARASATFPGVEVSGELDDVLGDPNVHGVVIATDAPSHAELAHAVLAAGKDLLVEKPLALTTDDARALCEHADHQGRVLMVGHLLLFHPVVQRLKAMIDAGELGEVLYLVCRRLNLGVVRRDENAWWSLAPHDLSIASYLLDDSPEAVSARGGVFLQKERQIEDVVFGTVRFGGGRLAHVHVSWLDPHKVRMLTVVGDKKMAVFDDGSPDEKLRIYDKGVEPPAVVGYEEGVRVRTGDVVVPAVRMAEPLRLEHEAFLKAIETREVPIADGWSGLAVVQALEAGARSLAAGGAEVKVEPGA
ncbi:MAG: Gfo/Idh/MocA family oxidoreductase [Polyangiales bacterium]